MKFHQPLVRRLEDDRPDLALQMRAHWERFRGEPELRLAVALSEGAQTAVDIGANRGVYSWWFAQQSSNPVAFEPNASVANLLRTALKNVTVHEVALSDTAGTAEFSVPTMDGKPNSYRGTLRPLEDSDASTITVETAPLDSIGLENVDFLKIDVEGAELEVLRGGRDTIARDQPIVLIEAEERHRAGAVDGVRVFFESLGFSGYFLRGRELTPIERFDLATHQDGSDDPTTANHRNYINNFLYLHESRRRYFAQQIRKHDYLVNG